MRNTLIFCLAVFTLAGCTSSEEWHASTCQDFGFQPGTPQFNKCVADEERRAWEIVGDSWDLGTDTPTYTTCNTAGSTTRCTSY